MKGWIVVISFVLCQITRVTSAPSRLPEGSRYPDEDETVICGTIRDVIPRDSGRFRRIIVRNTKDLVDYKNDDARLMTSRTKSKLDVLGSLVKSHYRGNVKARVLLAWTDQVSQSDRTSLHYEGRSVRLATSDGDRGKLGRLAGLAIEAGFDWVGYERDTDYIRASVIPDVCQTSVDLVFLLDGSGSVTETNFIKVKNFVKRVIDFFNIGRDGTRVAVATYSSSTKIEFNLMEHFTKNSLRNAVDDIEYPEHLTYTGEALDDVRTEIFTVSAGMRADPGIPKVLLLLTDGYSNGKSVSQPAKDLRALGVNIFSIGVGSKVSRTELNTIASGPKNVFFLSSFNELADFVDRVSSVSCSEGSLINSCDDATTTVDSGSFKYFQTTFDVVTEDEISVEIRDLEGTSHLYASSSNKNPGPLDPQSLKNEDDSAIKAVSVKLDASKTVFVAVQGQRIMNKFRLSFWDNLFGNSGNFQLNIEEEKVAHLVTTLQMVQHNYNLMYSISDGNSAGKFVIEKTTPTLSTTMKLDYETTRQFSLVIVADDVDNRCHRSRALVTINLLDINDNSPIFTKNLYTASIPENTRSGTPVKTVKATDKDSGENAKITYSITSSNAPSGLFDIDSFSGEVTLRGSLDFETTKSYAMTIKAEDNGSPRREATAKLDVSVTNVNEPPSISCFSSCFYSVSEDANKDTSVGRILASDPDTSSNCFLTYSMPETAAAKFTVNNGNIVTVASLDRETKAQYSFYITVRDCEGLTDSVLVSIRVNDVNDNNPLFPGPYSTDVSESVSRGSRVIQVKATDADEGDNGKIKYFLNPNSPDSAYFQIDSNDGTITTAVALDYETRKTYSFTVIARDQGVGGTPGSTEVTVNVKDVNDNAPVFLGTPYVAKVNENSEFGTPVIDVNATDVDSGSGGDVSYSIISGNPRDDFAIDPKTGMITVNHELDHETTPLYNLVVVASDQGSPSFHSTTTVAITVGDTNDNKCVFQNLQYFKTIPEDFSTTRSILTVTATDDDSGKFGDITYSIDSSDAKETFVIDNNGNIKAKKSLDFETKERYTFNVICTDGGGLSNQALVMISVSDVNDNTPQFDQDPYNVSVIENSKPGKIGKVTATDEDSSQLGSVTYSITGGNTGNIFSINANGEVFALISLDREDRELYTLTITATDGGSKSSTTRMHITVLDVNDNAPSFGKGFYSFMINENNSPNAEVGEFGPATDRDKGANGEIVYTIKSGDSNGDFEYDPSGKLKAKKILDRETIPVYNLQVEARDKGLGEPLATIVRVQVVVLDENDNGPVFSENPYNCEIDENSAANSRVCSVFASDKDAGLNGQVTYELTTSSSTFSVDQDSGEVKALVTLDRETTSSYSFDVIAKDLGSSSKTATVTVNVKVLDENDNRPKFNQSSYTFDVSEGAQLNDVVGHVFAEDDDKGLNGKVVYSISDGNTGSAFEIDGDTGRIIVKSSLDRETIANYRLTVVATDRGNPAQSSSRKVAIIVTDINDHDPIFQGEPYNGTIAEDASVGSPVVQVKATDADSGKNSQIKYSITGGIDNDHFTIDEDSGFIKTATKLDYERKKSYSLAVEATDGGDQPRKDTTQVSIAIQNANDNAPTFVPGSPVVSVSESVAIGTNVVKFNATDKDGNSLTFSITSGNTDGAFSIDKNTGVMTTNASLDRETTPMYNLTITVQDSGGQSSSRDLGVIVTDVNDNAPIFDPDTYSVEVDENTPAGFVVTVTATDADKDDNAKITFSIDSSSNKKFLIDSTSGKISSRAPLDHEESPRYDIKVTATDSGKPPLSSTVDVVVIVRDLNDNNPHFKGDYSTSLRENTASGTVIIVEATDPDSGVNGEIEYSITGGDDDGFFTIDSGGSITVVKPPDREQNPLFTLTITARNKVPAVSNALPTKTTATVTIAIDDVNDNEPRITNTETSVAVQENSTVNTPVIDVNAVDNDIGVNGEIEFAIVDGNIDSAFKINSTSGLITVQGEIDRENRDSYTLKVRVSDKGSPRLFSEKDFLVNITDVNDNKPVFVGVPYAASVSEAANASTFVIQVEATDADSGLNGKVRYSIVSGNNKQHFTIDQDSGEITTNAPLDFETTPAFTLRVKAEDPKFSVETDVAIRIQNINDNRPIFNPAYYKESIPENQGQSDSFVTVNATDEDPIGGLTYRIVSGNTDNRFTLHPSSGELRVAGELDRESIHFYNLTIEVTDGGGLADTAFVEIRITDINDNAPKFNTTREQVSVKENSPLGFPVLTVIAEDDDIDMNGKVRYDIKNGNNEGLFNLDEVSGQLTVKGNVDRETKPSFRLEIVAQDLGTPSLKSSPLLVEITVLDVNDNSPKFDKDSYTSDISEASSEGSIVQEVQATDADIGLNAEVVYALVNGSQFFKINNKTGAVSTRVKLDRENIASHTIIIIAEDLGDPARNSTTTLTVAVTDANDNAPQFDPDTLTANVTEERPKGQFVTRVVATDLDVGQNAEIEYDLGLNAKQILYIDSKTGEVTTKGRFDFETQRNYTFEVTAKDKGNPSLFSTASLHITVLDTDDNCPVFKPKEYNVTVEENRPLNETIVQVFATDVDTVGDEKLEYGIRSGNVDNTFRIIRFEGVIKSTKFIDREVDGLKNSQFNMVVRAGDDLCGVNFTGDIDEVVEERLSKSTASVNVFVTDVNDNAPVFKPSTYLYTYTQIDVSSLLWLNATDADEGINAEFDFGLAGVTRVDSKRTLLVTATDKGTPQLSSNTTVDVIGENCEAMTFAVSAGGHVTVKTLCKSRVTLTGRDLVGKSMMLDCKAEGNTVPEYRWTRDGVPVSDWKDDGRFVIDSLRKDDAGKYSCIASSDAGNVVSRSLEIKANEAAKIAKPPKETWAKLGAQAKLSCSATGDKPLRFSWYKNGKKGISNPELNYDKADLVFKKTIKEDEAEYACGVRNNFGSEKSKEVELHLYDDSAVVEVDLNINNPQAKENCQLFDITSFKNTLDGLTPNGKVAVVEYAKPKTVCNITACLPDPCKNQGKCTERDTGFVCQCPRGWTGTKCENDVDECDAGETCRNNGTCVNRKGSFSCDCPKSTSGKLCQFKEETCKSVKCNTGETCYPKESSKGYECIANDKTVKMTYKLEDNHQPFEPWMLDDIAQNIQNIIGSFSQTQSGSQERRKRRDTSTNNIDFGDCSVRIVGYKLKADKTLDLDVVQVCQISPNKTVICKAMLAEKRVESCTNEKGEEMVEPEPTEPPTMAPVSITVAIVVRDPETNTDASATDTIDTLKENDVEGELQNDGVNVDNIRARLGPETKARESSGLSIGAIAGIIVAIMLLVLVAAMILFVFLRTKSGKPAHQSFNFMTMADRSPVKTALRKKSASVRDLDESELRGVMNDTYDEKDGRQAHFADSTESGSWFMVKNPEFTKRTIDFVAELKEAPYYYGKISRERAEEILNDRVPAGTFIARSGARETEFYISVRAPEGGPNVRHIEVDRCDDEFVAVFGTADDAMGFATFAELIEYLRTTPTHFEGCENDLLLTDYVDRLGVL